MKIFISVLLVLFIIIFQKCSDNNVSSEDGLDVKPVIFTTNNINSLLSDSVSIEQIEINNELLIIYCSYLGGCQIHSLNVFAEMGFMETSPVQMRMRLTHHAYSDSCKDVINEKLYFDLEPFAELYKSAYRTNHGAISFFIYGSDTTKFYLPQPIYQF